VRRSALFSVTASALLASMLVSCSSTTMMSHWTDPEMSGKKLGTVLVIGVAKNDGRRRIFEDSFVKTLKSAKVQALASYPMLPKADQISEETVAPIVKDRGINQVIVTRLVDRQKVQEYVPPSVTTTYAPAYPSYYYGGWYGYYNTSYATVVTPGYTYETEYATLETNVYDVATGKLVWSGVTSTEISQSVERHVAELVNVLASYMKQDKII